jgi:hypothetical protein
VLHTVAPAVVQVEARVQAQVEEVCLVQAAAAVLVLQVILTGQQVRLLEAEGEGHGPVATPEQVQRVLL